MPSKNLLPIFFFVTSGLFIIFGTYLLTTQLTFAPQLFIAACGEVINNIREHIHLNSDGVLGFLTLLVTAMGVSLALFQLLRFIISHRQLQGYQTERELPANLRATINKHNLSKDIVSVVKNTKLTAYTIGLFRPRIIISHTATAKLSRKQLEAVILHEWYHLRNRHVLWLLLSRLASSLFFFIPLVEYLARQLKIEFELAADSFVIEKQKTKNHLCDSLALNIQYVGGVIPHFATSPIEKRVEFLVGNKIPWEKIGIKHLGISLFSICLMIVMTVIQPNQVFANFIIEKNTVCDMETKCQITNCTNKQSQETHNMTPYNSTPFSHISSY